MEKESTKEAFAIFADEIFTEDGILRYAGLLVKDGRFAAFVPQDEERLHGVKVLKAGGCKILPGLFDTHIHGACGRDTMEASPAALDTIGRYLASVGTTSWLPTTVTERLPVILSALWNLKAYRPPAGAAVPRGAFVEGPYLTAEHRGAHPQELLRELCTEEMEELLAAGVMRALALAPEKEGAEEFIRKVRAAGVHVSLGHSSASYEEARRAVDAGADAAIHTYCGMSSLHHRAPMLLGEAMTDDRLYAELIADGIHVSVPAMEILRRVKPKEKLILISDAIAPTGAPDGDYRLGCEHVRMAGGVARVDSGAIAGSTTHLLAEVRLFIHVLGEDPLAAVHMASLNPARRYALDGEIGSIKEGKRADFLLVDKDYHLQSTWIGGGEVFQRS